MSDIAIRQAKVEDGARVYQLVGELEGLEQNTCYAYLLLCSHFADTSVVAEMDGNMVGFVMSYIPPTSPDAVFVWQVGVHSDARGKGLGTRLLNAVFDLPACKERGVKFVEATVGTGNTASQALFRGFAAKRGVPCNEGPGYPAHLFEPESHEDEDLFRIGPIGSSS